MKFLALSTIVTSVAVAVTPEKSTFGRLLYAIHAQCPFSCGPRIEQSFGHAVVVEFMAEAATIFKRTRTRSKTNRFLEVGMFTDGLGAAWTGENLRCFALTLFKSCS